jgi:hypothetical protein
MTSNTQLDTLFAQWALPFTDAAVARHGIGMREVEQELRQRLAQNDAAALEWIGQQCPVLDSCAYQVLQRVVSRVSVRIGSVATEACLAFCPVTIVLTTTHTELPRIDCELFRNIRPQGVIDALRTHGLIDDCNVSVDPVMLPSARVAAIGLAELPSLVRSMADAAALICRVDRTHRSDLPQPNQGMLRSVSIAGGRVIGSLLIPLLFFADDLGELPAVLNGQMPQAELDAFRHAASLALTTTQGRVGPVRISFIVSAPEMIFDAIIESTSAHCDTAAYWASRAAIDAGGRQCAVTFRESSNPIEDPGVWIGFDAGQGVECGTRMFAMDSHHVDLYTEAFAAGAHAAGMTTVRIEQYPATETGHR